ncbi:Bifunctional (p)ppGpp synthase/hydrolase relA [Planctomycetes bacterium Pla163]|uniref:Bifunctional (P)ppGpp synthase/hydrolase relA n=1 Tax=Rohdeia mirabilis TaxID=2528008 RepID=A0A518D3Q7_9BACT|nr:Bifunctional (p)ppGpp synthase/hydrolase relA [Planctomycetes bacterium Pla163]
MYSHAVERALAVAIEAHAPHRRKGNNDPYVVHPVHMALLLAQLGADEVTVQAALLHDVAEDADDWDLPGLARAFGDDVASVVAELTEDKRQSWEVRKRTALEHVPHLSERGAAVKSADVLHNLSSLAAHLESMGDTNAAWQPFSGGKERTLTQHRAMVAALSARTNERLADALRTTLGRILAVCGETL